MWNNTHLDYSIVQTLRHQSIYASNKILFFQPRTLRVHVFLTTLSRYLELYNTKNSSQKDPNGSDPKASETKGTKYFHQTRSAIHIAESSLRCTAIASFFSANKLRDFVFSTTRLRLKFLRYVKVTKL